MRGTLDRIRVVIAHSLLEVAEPAVLAGSRRGRHATRQTAAGQRTFALCSIEKCCGRIEPSDRPDRDQWLS
jgi:hypothetical protein